MPVSGGKSGALAPVSACSGTSAIVRSWNDALPTAEARNRLQKPLPPRLNGTRNKSLEAKRTGLVAAWFISVYVPAWLHLAALNIQEDSYAASQSRKATEVVRDAAGDVDVVATIAAGVAAM